MDTAVNGDGYTNGFHEKKKADDEYALGMQETMHSGEERFSRLWVLPLLQ